MEIVVTLFVMSHQSGSSMVTLRLMTSLLV
jgi:hypothetical protein